MTDAPVSLAVEELARVVLDGVEEGGERKRADLGLLPVFEDERPLQGLSGFVDWRACGRLTGLLRSGLCTGALGERVLLPGRSTLPVERIVMVGLGDSASFDGARAAEVGAMLVELARDMSARRVMLAVPTALSQRDATEALFAAVAQRLAEPRPAPAPATAPEPEPELAPELAPEPATKPEVEAGIGSVGEVVPEADAEPADSQTEGGPEPDRALEDGAEASPGDSQAETDADAPSPEVVVRAAQPTPPREQWWAVAEARLVQRLRSVLAGPPRAAADEGG